MDIRVHTVRFGSFRDLDGLRARPPYLFAEQVMDSAPSLGRFLDVGCGPGLQPQLVPIADRVTEYHGIDPSDEVQQHPMATRKFQGAFETADLPKNYYDTALAYNVLEHISEATPFFQQVHAVLKPGGSFWALTPHAGHPFAHISNMVRWLSLKQLYRSKVLAKGVNEYPSYYRLNSPRAVSKAIKNLGFASADFWMVPSVQWDTYVPPSLRVFPHLYDRVLGGRVGAAMLLLTMRLVKA